MPTALAVVALSDRSAETALLVVSGVAAAVFAYTLIQARSGRWADMDASRQSERVELNVFLVLALCVSTAAAWALDAASKLILGLALAAAIVVAALLLRTLFKLSLHVAFAIYAVFVVWPNSTAAAAFAVLACAVAWSRLVLRRHTRIEVVAGGIAGAAAGLALVAV